MTRPSDERRGFGSTLEQELANLTVSDNSGIPRRPDIPIPNVAQLQRDPASVSRSHKLIILSNPPAQHKLWEGTLASYETSGSVHFQSSTQSWVTLPPTTMTGFRNMMTDDIEVRVCINGRKLNPSIGMQVAIYRGDRSRQCIFTAQVDWPFAPIKHHGGPPKSGVTALTASIDDKHQYLELGFTPECAVSSNLLPISHDRSLLQVLDDENLTDSELCLLRDLANMVEYPHGRRLQLRFDINEQERRLLAAGDTQTPHGRLLERLPTVTNTSVSPDFIGSRWKYYRKDLEKLFGDSSSSSSDLDDLDSVDPSGVIDNLVEYPEEKESVPALAPNPLQVVFDQMKSRHAILSRDHPGTPIKPLVTFSDQDDALVSLAYGAYLEYVEQDITFQAVRRNAHSVRVCNVDNRVLALVDFSWPPNTGLPNDRFRLDDCTKVDLRIGMNCMDSEGQRNTTASGIIVANVFGLPRCDLLVLITNKWVKSFKHLAHPIELFREDPTNIIRTPIHVSPQLNKSPYKAEVEAVVRAYGRACPVERLPFLLGDGSKLEPVNPVSSANQRSKVLPSFGRLLNAKPWNEAQLRVINSISKAPGGSMIVTGPGGTGKTELICHLVQFAVGCGHYTIVSGTRNDTLDDMTLKIDRVDPSINPVRVYAPSTESLASLCDSKVSVDTPGYSHRLLVNTFDAIEADTKKSRRSLPRFSVLGKVIQGLDRPPLMRRFRVDQGQQRKSVDVRAYFKDRLPLLRVHMHSKDRPWINGDEEREFLFQAYRYLRAEVLSEARVVLCTNAISGNPDVCINFAVGCKVWLFQDEAQSMTEAAALIPMGLNTPCSNFDDDRKVVMHFLSGDLNQLPPFTMSRSGRYNTVNEFYPQRNLSLFERKIQSGFPAINLVEQRRAAEILMRGANMFTYGGKLVTPNYPPLASNVENLIPYLAGFQMKAGYPHHTVEKRRLAWIEVDSQVYENKYTGSRANPTNADLVRECLIKVQSVYGRKTSAEVMLATPYKRQKELYLSMVCQLKATFGWTNGDVPRICTIDSLIGRESSLVILDLVNNRTEGFLRDVRRSCVAFTRAKDMFLVIGGTFSLPPRHKQLKPKILKDPVTGLGIYADMSRPLTFYHSFFKINGFMYSGNMTGVKASPIPTDLRPLGNDHEHEHVGAEFAEEEYWEEDEPEDDCELMGCSW